MSTEHSSAIQRWMQSGKPLLQIPSRFAEDKQVEMSIQSRHLTWSRRTRLDRAQEGTFRGEIPPEMDENLKKVLESTQAATALEGGRALASSAATNAGACGSAFTAGACGSASVGGIFASHCRLLRQRLQRTRGHQRRH